MNRLISILALLWLAGCAGARTPAAAGDGIEEEEPRPGSASPVVWAGADPLEPAGELRWIYHAAARVIPEIAPDARLARAAETLLEILTAGERTPTRRERNRATLDAGVAEPVPVMLLISASGYDRDRLGSMVRQRLARHCRDLRCNRIGAAMSRDRDRLDLVVLAMASQLRMDPIPRQVPSGGALSIRGEASPAVSATEVLVSPPSGTVRTLLEAEGRRFDVDYRPEADGLHRFEIVGRIDGSPTVIGLFTVMVGRGEAPPALPEPASHTTAPAAARTKIHELVNAARVRSGLARLERHPGLDRTAQAYAETMLERGFFGHLDPEGHGPPDRVRDAGILASVVRENLAIAPSAEEAHQNLRESPIHWRATLDPRTTHMGVGIARGPDGGLRTVILMAKLLPAFERGEAAREVLGAINAARRERSLPPLAIDPALTAAADVAADRVDDSVEEAREAARAALAGHGYEALTAILITTGELDGVATISQVLSPGPDRAGVAVRLAGDRTAGYHVVVLLAR